MTPRDQVFLWLRKAGLIGTVNVAANLWLRSVKGLYRAFGRRYVESIYSDGYFDVEEGLTLESAPAVARLLVAEFRPRRVADVGCGTAVYLAELLGLGVEVQGFEWSRAAIDRARIDDACIAQVDLTQPLDHPRTYDLVICFEVAEHLPRLHARQLIANLVRLGPTVAFSAAQPGQGGRDHVNEQPPEFWIRQFADQGYEFLGPATERLRQALRDQGAVWWLVRNLLLFQRLDGKPMSTGHSQGPRL